ncbi:MAG TPA: hypothetical protein VMA77_00390 [Solirubrobacteraceae bacterium]|nr:hypothetical protein [Solirubrobacteraceae bacterium]
MFRFWRRIFGICVALGVVCGIVMTFAEKTRKLDEERRSRL